MTTLNTNSEPPGVLHVQQESDGRQSVCEQSLLEDLSELKNQGCGSIQHLPIEEPLRAAAEVLGRGLRAQSENSVVKTTSSRAVCYRIGMPTYRKRPNRRTKMQVMFSSVFVSVLLIFYSGLLLTACCWYAWVVATDLSLAGSREGAFMGQEASKVEPMQRALFMPTDTRASALP